MAKSITPTQVTPELIQEITRKIVDAFHPRRIILFGSHARSDAHPDSDLDLLVEMESELPYYERVYQAQMLFIDRVAPIDILVFTPAEISEQRKLVASIFHSIDREGIVLYDYKS
jgi:predicted nucleotidyltransferase